MKVAICNVQEFNPTIGGIERVSVSLGNELIKCGIDVIYIAAIKSSYSKPYTLPAEQIFLPEASEYSSENVKAFINIIRCKSVDIIINQSAHNLNFDLMLKEVKDEVDIPLVSAYHFCPFMRSRFYRNMIDFRFFSVKENLRSLVYDISTRWPFTYLTMRNQRRLFSLVYAMSDKVVLLSDKYFAPFESIGKLNDTSKLVAIHNMLSYPYEASVNMETKRKEILFVGRFFSEKMPMRALYAWKRLHSLLPDWKLVMVGDGPWYQRLVNLCRSMGLSNIEFTGLRDPSPYYKTASVLWMTSNFEGWPLALTEAMQNGCVPVAFSSFESIRDIIDDGRNGCLAEPFDIDEFVTKTKEIITKGNLREYSHNANVAMKMLCPETIVRQWTDILSPLHKDNFKS